MGAGSEGHSQIRLRSRVGSLEVGPFPAWSYTGNKLHPTQKPVSVLLPLVETFSYMGGTVMDPFAGSGSTLLAAKTLGRNYIGIELDAKYHSIATERLNATP